MRPAKLLIRQQVRRLVMQGLHRGSVVATRRVACRILLATLDAKFAMERRQFEVSSKAAVRPRSAQACAQRVGAQVHQRVTFHRHGGVSSPTDHRLYARIDLLWLNST